MSKKIFISYSHKDEEHRESFEEQLAILKRKNIISVWHDRKITAGDCWAGKIDGNLESADIIVFLISPSFLSSDYCADVEVKMAMQREENGFAKIIPVIVRPCDWNDCEFAKFQVVPKGAKPITSWTDRDSAWFDVATSIKQCITEDTQKTSSANNSPQNNKINITRLPRPSTQLVGRKKHRERMTKLLADPDVAAVGFVAPGGVGKSALVDTWLQDIYPHYGGATVIFGWSFYSQGSHQTQANSSQFFSEALPFFGHMGEIPKTDEKKAEVLGGLLKRNHCLLILDGIEPLQYPPTIEGGRFKDQGMSMLMRILASSGLGTHGKNGLVVITSRQSIPAFESRKEGLYREIELETLSITDGTQLLINLGVTTGLPIEFHDTVENMNGHALALVLLGKLLKQQHLGDIARCDQVQNLFDAPEGQHAERVMAHYDIVLWPGKTPERIFLRLLGLFDRPMEKGAFEALRKKAAIAHPLKTLIPPKFNQMISNLEQAGLLLSDQKDGGYKNYWDTHPLVRSYFGDTFKVEDEERFKQAHEVLFNYFQLVPRTQRPDTVEELEPLYRAIHHGCQAEKYLRAMDQVLRNRIHRRGEYFSQRKLGAFSSDLSALTGFFPNGWESPVVKTLPDDKKEQLLSIASRCLMSSGRLHEAMDVQQGLMQFSKRLNSWNRATIAAGNFVDSSFPIGQLNTAKMIAQQGIEWANNTPDVERRYIIRTKMATVLHRLGELDNSLKLFVDAEKIKKEDDPDHLQSYSLPGAWYCALLQDKSHDTTALNNVLRRGEISLKIALQENQPFQKAYAHLVLGRVLTTMERLMDARLHLDHALMYIRASEWTLHTPEYLIDRAALLRKMGKQKEARSDLYEALEITGRCGMILFEADARLLETYLYLDENNQTQAGKSLERAEQLIEDMKYGRQIAPAHMVRARFFNHVGDQDSAKRFLNSAEDQIKEVGQWGLIPEWKRIKQECGNH